jgi:hypothetical protein
MISGLVTSPLKRVRSQAGKHDTDTGALWTAPWSWRSEDGLYIGHNGDGWLYRALPISPLAWEDPLSRLNVGSPLEVVLREIGAMSTDPAVGLALTADEREIHLLSVTWEEPGEPPAGTPEQLAEFQRACLDFLLPRKVLVLGVKLKTNSLFASSGGRRGRSGSKSLLKSLREVGERALAEDIPDRSQWDDDFGVIDRILSRAGARNCTPTELRQIESWFNLGRGVDVLLDVTKDTIFVDDFDRVEMAVVRRFSSQVSYAPEFQWALDASTHPEGPSVISVRGSLQTANAARARARSGLRRRRSQMEEEMATGDVERIEDTESFQQSQQVENWIALSQEPIVTRCSIIMARRVSEARETYIDELRNRHGIEVAPLPMRQLEALDECLPTSIKRVNPFLQDVSISQLAYCGLQGWTNLGDEGGVLAGLGDPDYMPVYLDPMAAPRANKPPAMLIAGEPGSGKTYLCQLIATQSVLGGQQVIFINPKGFDSLSPFAELVGGTVVKMSQLEGQGGYFDPFYYAEPAMAAEIATTYILGVLGNTGVAGMGFSADQELRLSAGLKRGAASGARCVLDALAYVDDPEVRRMVNEQMVASSTFGLGIGSAPRERYQSSKGLTLIEFDRKLDFPERGKNPMTYTRSERISLAAIRLVTRAAMEILVTSGGGVMVVDEAWTFLSSNEGLGALQQLGREGRSLNLLPIFATQRIDDLIKEGVDMESYISRVMVMKLTDEREALAAMKLCRLEATPDRIAFLRNAGPIRASEDSPGRPAVGLHRDLRDRHAAVFIGPVPPSAHEAFTTNPEERRARDEKRARERGIGDVDGPAV